MSDRSAPQDKPPQDEAQAGRVELLPCPFCNGEASKGYRDTMNWCGCANVECPVMPEAVDYVSDETLIAAWNTRAALASGTTAGVAAGREENAYKLGYYYGANCFIGDESQMAEAQQQSWEMHQGDVGGPTIPNHNDAAPQPAPVTRSDAVPAVPGEEPRDLDHPTPDQIPDGVKLADAMEVCDWSTPSIGNTIILKAAVARLRLDAALRRDHDAPREGVGAEQSTFNRWHLDALVREWCAGPGFDSPLKPHLIDGLCHTIRIRLDRADRARLADQTEPSDRFPRLVQDDPHWVEIALGHFVSADGDRGQAALAEIERMRRIS